MPLNDRQQAFVEHYLRCWNGYQAAKDAGYAETSARHQASRLLSNDNIREAIQERLTELRMSADEVLTRLTDQARGTADDFLTVYASPLRDVITGEPIRDGDGQEIVRYFPSLDIEKARQRGKLHLVKTIRYTAHGPAVELYDAQAALALLAKHHGLLKDQVEHSGKIDIGNLSDDELRAIVENQGGS